MEARTDVLQRFEKLLTRYVDKRRLPITKASQGVLAAKVFSQVYSVMAEEYRHIAHTAGLDPSQWIDEENQALSAWIESRNTPLPFGTNGLPHTPQPKPMPWQIKLLEPPARWQHGVAVLALVILAGAVIGLRLVLLMPK